MSKVEEKRRVILTHYDLDGVGCFILLNKLFKFQKKVYCGYKKVREKIDAGVLSGYDSCFVTDISPTTEQYMKLSQEYGDKFMLFDHHKPSLTMLDSLESNDSRHYVDLNFSATGIIYKTFYKFLKHYPDLPRFVRAVDAYDNWRYKSHPESFQDGYDLNILFWEYHFDKFSNRFMKDLTFNFNDYEKKLIKKFKDNTKGVMEDTIVEPFGENSAIFLNVDPNYINEYTLHFTEYDVFYIVYSYPNSLNISVRTTRDDIDLGKIIKEHREVHEEILGGGGHSKASGIELKVNTKMDTIIDIIEQINNDVEGNKYWTTDVPF